MKKKEITDSLPTLDTSEKSTEKKVYEKPQLRSEKLMTFGALCNGTTTGGRKQTGPVPCNTGKLLS